ncbi:MAG: dTMP kinase [bacterium]|nr:dTMP kinase [bacterium]
MVLIVLDGVDGAGKSTQLRLLVEALETRGVPVRCKHYPDYDHELGQLIKKYLQRELELPADSLFLLFLADMLKDRKELAEHEGVLLLDRYATSSVAYEAALGLELERLAKIVELLQLPSPALIIYLDVDPRTAMQRKGGGQHRFENAEFLLKVRQNFLQLAKMHFLCPNWKVVCAERPAEEVFKDVLQAVLEVVNAPK